MKNMTVTYKLVALLCVAALCAALLFIAVRVTQKPAYEAHEKRQCELLASSLLMLFVEKTEVSPGVWSAFSNDEIILTLDHRAMPGNWNVKLTAKRSLEKDAVSLKAEAASGWNSRSPQDAARHALLFDIGKDNLRISTTEAVDFIPSQEHDYQAKVLSFTYLNEKEPPVKIEAQVANFVHPDDNETYIVLKLND